METRTILCLVLFFATFLHPSLSDSELCHPDDKKVLLEIKKSFNDPGIFASWDPKNDCCNWTFITCDDDNRVAALMVEDVDCNLVGPIPPEVGDLPYLQWLSLEDCPDLTGTIPPSIAKLNNLVGLGFGNTSISGPIPEFIGDFKDLVILHLSHNSFSGSIPNTIGSLPQLLFLDLSYNQLSGPIPWGLTKLVLLILLDVSFNRLSGEIPQGGKLQSFPASAYLHNKCLCGEPLPPCCSCHPNPKVGFI